MNNKISLRKYINPSSNEIKDFANSMIKNTNSLEDIIQNIFSWFDENISYSRLQAPYFPLQRNDLDVLSMKSGTCGDYSNLIVSVLINLGFNAKYAYLKRDCYGHEQDHVCAAVEVDTKLILIDATLPYRKWHGFNCKHMEYDLYSPEEFEMKMKKEEDFFYEKALKLGNENFGGLLYAPWIYDDVLINSKDRIESVFYLLICEDNVQWTLWVNYIVYTKTTSSTPLLVRIDETLKRTVQFSVNKPTSLWDNSQWSEELSIEDTPENLKSDYFYRCLLSIDNNIHSIHDIILNI